NLPVRIGAVTLNAGEGRLRRGVIDTVNGYAYFASVANTPTYVAKIALGAGANPPTRVGTATIDDTQHNIGTAVIDVTNGYAYFGSYDTSAGLLPARVYKMALGA